MLARRGVDEPLLDAEILLAHALAIDRTRLIARARDPLDAATRRDFARLLRRRAAREPVAYLIGRREFHGLEITVTKDVLVPRPETEAVVDAALAALDRVRGAGRALRVLDAGTGSGAIAVAIAVRDPAAQVVAVDVSERALSCAEKNARRHGVADRVAFVRCDIAALARVFASRSFDVLASNPPYVAEPAGGFRGELAHEPRIALSGVVGPFPAIYRELAQAAGALLVAGGSLIAEVGSGQAERVRAVIAEHGAFGSIEVLPDLAGIPRVVVARAN